MRGTLAATDSSESADRAIDMPTIATGRHRSMTADVATLGGMQNAGDGLAMNLRQFVHTRSILIDRMIN